MIFRLSLKVYTSPMVEFPSEPARRLCARVGGAHGAVLSALRASTPRHSSGSIWPIWRSGPLGLPDTYQEIMPINGQMRFQKSIFPIKPFCLVRRKVVLGRSFGEKQFNLVRIGRTDVRAKSKSCGLDLYLRRIDYGMYKTRAHVYERERQREETMMSMMIML